MSRIRFATALILLTASAFAFATAFIFTGRQLTIFPCWLASPYILLFFPFWLVKSVRDERAMQLSVLVVSALALIITVFAYFRAVHDPSSSLEFGIMPPCMMIVGPIVLWGTYEVLVRTVYKHDHFISEKCRKCDYDLRGSIASLRCPECGESIPFAQRRYLRREFNSE